MNLKQIILLLSLGSLMIAGCASLSPAVNSEETVKIQSQNVQSVSDDNEKDKIIIKKTEIPEVEADDSSKIKPSKEEPKQVSPENASYNISALAIEAKANGVLIKLTYSGNDPKENITAFFSGDNFFNISFYKGKLSDSVKDHVYDKSIARSVKFFEFKDSVQITLWFREEYKSSVISTDNKTIIISVFN